ncbi:MAG: extracellular solute-binding protein [Clostridia bacterium]|nr:extracellular solute-binding protein [Clostridia bacterium]
MKKRWLSAVLAVVVAVAAVPMMVFAVGDATPAVASSVSEDEARLNVANCVAQAGETVQLHLGVQSTGNLKALSLSGLTYNRKKLELVSGEWAEMGQSLAHWDEDMEAAVIAFEENTDVAKVVFTLTFRIKETVPYGEVLPVSCQATAKKRLADGRECNVDVTATAGSITVGIPGDIDGNGVLEPMDPICLLYRLMLPEVYSVAQPLELNGDGMATTDDAIYLLYHVMLSENYPLSWMPATGRLTVTNTTTTAGGDDYTTSAANKTTAAGSYATTMTTSKAATTTQRNTTGVATTTTSNTTSPSDPQNIPMPTRDLKNKTVTVFSWRDQQSENCYGASKPDMRKVYNKVGLETKWYQATHDIYVDRLAVAVASGDSPDLVEWNTTQMYPAAIESGLVVPIDAYIDFSAPIWDDVRELTAKYQINGKTFFSVEYMQIAEFVYYNPELFKQYALETPLELWREGKWTLTALQKMANALVAIDDSGNVTRLGFVPGNIGAITGLELVEYNRTYGYKLNISNTKYKTLMNIMYNMGVKGTRSAGFDAPTGVAKGTVAMAQTAGWAMTNEMNAARERGELEWVILPKLDDTSKHYYNVNLQQTFGLVKGAKNPEGAAYLIELRKWAFLNYPLNEYLPFTDTAYTREFGEKMDVNGGTLTAAEIQYTQEMLSQGYDVVANNLWGGWVGSVQFPGITEVISNGNTWSTVLKNKKASLEAVLKQWDFSGV